MYCFIEALYFQFYIYLGSYYDSSVRHSPLFSFIPEFLDINEEFFSRVSRFISCSSLTHTIVSLELDNHCVFPIFPIEDVLLFSQSPHLTHIRIALHRFDDCVRLLSQLRKQLRSLFITVRHVSRNDEHIMTDLFYFFLVCQLSNI
jgi:hypothetical protein